MTKKREKEVGIIRLLLIPTPKNYGLPVLVDINLTVFLVMAFNGISIIAPSPADLILWGGNFGPALHGPGLLRLISCQFVHAGAKHLMNNLYGLLFSSLYLTPVLTNWRLIACYLLCGFVGSVAGYLAHPEIVSVGASGSIMGFWGILLSLALLRDPRVEGLQKPIFITGASSVGLTLLIGLAPNIDNAAHIGGLAAGLAIGTAMTLAGRKSGIGMTSAYSASASSPSSSPAGSASEKDGALPP